MRRLSETQWKFLSKSLRVIGIAGCAVTFLSLLGLQLYFSAVRPHAPVVDSGLTTPLPWTHPRAYGTAQDRTIMMRFFDSFGPFFVLLVTSFAIKTYKPERVLYLMVGLAAFVGFLIVALTIS